MLWPLPWRSNCVVPAHVHRRPSNLETTWPWYSNSYSSRSLSSSLGSSSSYTTLQSLSRSIAAASPLWMSAYVTLWVARVTPCTPLPAVHVGPAYLQVRPAAAPNPSLAPSIFWPCLSCNLKMRIPTTRWLVELFWQSSAYHMERRHVTCQAHMFDKNLVHWHPLHAWNAVRAQQESKVSTQIYNYQIEI